MLNKLKKGIKKAISSKPVTYNAKPQTLQSRPKGKLIAPFTRERNKERNKSKLSTYKGANFIKKR